MLLNKDFILRTCVCYTHYTALLPLGSYPAIRCLELFPRESFFFSVHASTGKPQKGCVRTENRGKKSDLGSTYTSVSYLELVQENGMVASMSRNANCYENAVTESLFHSFIGECIDREVFQTRAKARCAIFDYLEGFYNRIRRHSTLQYMSPVMYDQMMC
jgi:putative transposase